MPEPTKGKRRRGSQQQRRSASRPGANVAPVGRATISNRLPGLPWLAAGAIVLIAVIAVIVLLRPGGGGAGAATCPTSQPPALLAGQTRTVTLATPKGTMVLKIEANLSPIAAGNFVSLASCGFYDGTPFHRTPTLDNGTPFVIQGGDPTGAGTGGPGYTIKDEPVTTPYKRGTIAMARSSAPNSVGSQFFIVLDDKDGAILGDPSTNNYQIIGNVTTGMETADAIFAASAGVELPTNPIHITTATVANP